MAGVDTSRGIAYQNAQAVLVAIDVLSDANLASMRLEGRDDIVDIEVHDTTGAIVRGYQVKTRVQHRPWSRAPILAVLERWAALDVDADFEFVTDGELGETAIALRDAVHAASDGDVAPLAAFLNRPVHDPSLPKLARTRVRQDVTGAEAVLAVAEQQTRSLLPGARTPQDLRAAAQAAVNALLRELATRAGSLDEGARLITKDEIAAFLGGTRDIAAEDRWETGVKAEYLEHAGAGTDLIDLGLKEDVPDDLGRRAELADLLQGARVTVLSGRTGTGKSSIAELAVDEGAQVGRPVLRVHAEAYVAARLADLVAEGLAATLRRPLPSLTGQQALWDPDTVLIIDGVSEVPVQMQQALRHDLQPVITAASGAHVVLVGRDLATLSSVVPTSVPYRRYSVAVLTREKRDALVRRQHPEVIEEQSADEANRLVAQLIATVERGLGDAAGNPMLFSLALRFAVDGTSFENDAALYAATITRMAERAGATHVDVTSAALGLVLAHLLDSGRRFVYPHEYRRLLRAASRELESSYFGVDEAVLEANIRRSGLLVPLGADQVLVPVHDSYADYLAGLAHARGLAPLPRTLSTSDERRLEFAAQLAGVSDATAVQVARDLPFSIVRLASYDRRTLAERSSVETLAAVLSHLLPPGDRRSPVIWEEGESAVIALRQEEPPGRQDTSAAGPAASRVVMPLTASPLLAAAAVWRLTLRRQLRSRVGLPVRRPNSSEEAAQLVIDHVTERETHVRCMLLQMFQPVARERVAETLGPLGVHAIITRRDTIHSEFSMAYARRASINIEVAEEAAGESARVVDEAGAEYASTSVESFLRKHSREDAADLMKSAVEKLTKHAWLQ
ncbi:AAA domain-containing protein [Nocardioides terrae]|uniref:AAA domain-containing protein n=1 Tax=Nocardioides terrae TaxID=574651 RepID=A0A1I1NQC5_9ACTN|nr:AAA family ATPase [Nocardioides terrae]SFC96963.1 AAA domain-containing protein [Nocardioides terrae]